MSKTDKTNPYRVKVHDKKHWLQEHHDHTNGECNLPPRPKVGDEVDWNGKRGECFWWYSHDFWCDPYNHCPCKMCKADGWEGDPRNRKAIRREGKRLSRDYWKEME